MISIKKKIHNHKNNILSWKTVRKIVVIESDDWGSIRMSGKTAFDNLLKAGIAVDKSHYNLYDGLESNADLEGLFEVLSKHRDKNGRHPVFTGANIVGNPDFGKIKANNFSEYVFEPVTETYKNYGVRHNRVIELYREGISKRLFIPAYHGREHLNVKRWMKALRENNPVVQLGFENGVTGMPFEKDLQAAFAVDDFKEIAQHKEIMAEGLDLFQALLGFRTEFFVPPNGLYFNASSYQLLKDNGIKYLNSRKRMVLPDEHGNMVKDYRYTGMRNKFGQYYFIRNSFFEPSAPMNINHVDDCLKQIETGFFWHNPVIISSHRVNYIGWLHTKNRDRSLAMLDELLTKIIKRWPDVEFMTTIELGELISSGK